MNHMSGAFVSRLVGRMLVAIMVILLLSCSRTHIINGDVQEELLDFDAMTDVELGRTMYRRAAGYLMSVHSLPGCLEPRAERNKYIVLGTILSDKINREEIIEHIKRSEFCKILREIEVKIHRKHPPGGPDTLTIRYHAGDSYLGLTHDPTVSIGQNYLIFFDAPVEEEGKEPLYSHPGFAPVSPEGYVGYVLCAHDPFFYGNYMPLDWAWAYLANHNLLAAGLGTPISKEDVRRDLEAEEPGILICAFILLERLDEVADLVEVGLARLEQMFTSGVPDMLYGYNQDTNILNAALAAFTTHASGPSIERMFPLYESYMMIYPPRQGAYGAQAEIVLAMARLLMLHESPRREELFEIMLQAIHNEYRSMMPAMDKFLVEVQDEELQALFQRFAN